MLKTTNPSTQTGSRIVALDVGAKRIGVASAHVIARLASPLTTLVVADTVLDDIQALLDQEQAAAVVVGLPRGLEGQDTAQTATVRAFIEDLRPKLTVPMYWQDEALTSQKSEAELKAKKGAYAKGDIDALAATYILEDFLASNQELPNV